MKLPIPKRAASCMPSLREKLSQLPEKPSCDQNEVMFSVSLRTLKLMFIIRDGLSSYHIYCRNRLQQITPQIDCTFLSNYRNHVSRTLFSNDIIVYPTDQGPCFLTSDLWSIRPAFKTYFCLRFLELIHHNFCKILFLFLV